MVILQEIVLVVPARFTAITTDLHTARILDEELNENLTKYTHFELNNYLYK